MFTNFLAATCTAVLLFGQLSVIATQLQCRSTVSKYPFTQIVAFGDEFSDNGNGSYAAGITGSPATVYGYKTWTNGPVAVSYFADKLGLSTKLLDYAFGGCCGGSDFGATLDSNYTVSKAGAASLVDQLANYTSHSHADITKTLQFIWIGQNDLSKHTDAFWLTDPANTNFATQFSTRIAAAVDTLLDAGAPYVFVVGIYPKHLAPVTPKYLCSTNTACVTTWGKVIQKANSALQSSLKQFGTKVIYYDVFTFMVNLLNNATANGFTQPLSYYCDGDSNSKWTDCMVNGHASEYFWMNFVQPTSRVHQMIAADMKKTLDSHLSA